MFNNEIDTTCCIVGGGPAGMMLGLLLARAGIEVVVLEKHADFLRDFRGDTVHPSTLEVMAELNLLDDFLSRPHQKVEHLSGRFKDFQIIFADFSHLKVKAPYIAFMPQWDFLNFLEEHARTYSNFKLYMQAEATDIIKKDDAIVGAKVQTPKGEIQVNCKLLIGADGRHSTIRKLAGLTGKEYGAPMDVLWFRLSRASTDTNESIGQFLPGKIMIMINREDYWQCGFVIPKGESSNIQQKGLESFLEIISKTVPLFSERVKEIRSWEQIKLLTVKVDRLQKWYLPGLLCIGDAAHAMSPIGGVGINIAIQDAVATANVLIAPLRLGLVSEKHLRAIQRHRTWAVILTQKLQLLLQNRVIYKTLKNQLADKEPLPFRLLKRWPFLQRITGYLIGIGFGPEHIRPQISRIDKI